MRTPTLEQKSQTPFFSAVLSKILSRRGRISRTTSDTAQKMETIRPKLRFPCFSGGNCGTILSRRSRLSRTSRAPSRLSRPRPIDCHAGPKRTVKTFPGLANSCFEHRRKKSLFSTGPHLVVIHTQKEAHSRIFVTGGSLFARQMQAKKQVVSASRACTQGYCRLKFWGTLIYRVHQQAQHPE